MSVIPFLRHPFVSASTTRATRRNRQRHDAGAVAMPHRVAGTPGVGSLPLRAQVNPANHVLLCARVRGGACTRRERARKNRERWEGLGTGKGSGEDEGESVDMEKGRDRGLGTCAPFDAFRSGPPTCSFVSAAEPRAIVLRGGAVSSPTSSARRAFPLRLDRVAHPTFVIIIFFSSLPFSDRLLYTMNFHRATPFCARHVPRRVQLRRCGRESA